MVSVGLSVKILSLKTKMSHQHSYETLYFLFRTYVW